MAVNATMSRLRIGIFVTSDPTPTGRIPIINPDRMSGLPQMIITTGEARTGQIEICIEAARRGPTARLCARQYRWSGYIC
jgi:hypothetical protein